jgi:hypothetical protein
VNQDNEKIAGYRIRSNSWDYFFGNHFLPEQTGDRLWRLRAKFDPEQASKKRKHTGKRDRQHRDRRGCDREGFRFRTGFDGSSQSN